MLIIAALIIGVYTNHAGNVVAGWPVNLTATHVTLAEHVTPTANDQLPTTNHQLPSLDLPRIDNIILSMASKGCEKIQEFINKDVFKVGEANVNGNANEIVTCQGKCQ